LEKLGTVGTFSVFLMCPDLFPESFLLLAQLSAAHLDLGVAELLLDLGIEVGYFKHRANFDHFVIQPSVGMAQARYNL
jgi:hypothetical protein